MSYIESIPLVCQIKEIGEEQTFNRQNKNPFTKRMISLETHDGQKLFCELRRMQLLNGIQVGDIVNVSISFAGSEKNSKKYNNIFINEMTKK